jgi:hypothetical protein
LTLSRGSRKVSDLIFPPSPFGFHIVIRQPDIKDCLSEVQDDQRDTLIRKLLKIELATRTPMKDEKDYLLEFAKNESIIRGVFTEKKDAIARSLESTTDANPSTLVLDDTPDTEKRRPLIVDSDTFVEGLAEVGLRSRPSESKSRETVDFRAGRTNGQSSVFGRQMAK